MMPTYCAAALGESRDRDSYRCTARHWGHSCRFQVQGSMHIYADCHRCWCGAEWDKGMYSEGEWVELGPSDPVLS